MDYEIYAFYDGQFISKISYPIIRYFQTTIYDLFHCHHLMENGSKFINYRDLTNCKNESKKLTSREQIFLESLEGYDVVELRFYCYSTY